MYDYYREFVFYIPFQVPIKAIQGELYVRISAHIYNYLEEYKKLAEGILELVARCVLQQ